MTYYTLNAPCTATLEIKKSQFLGFGYPIDSRELLMFHVEQLRSQYPDARHVCYGYIIGDPRNTTSAQRGPNGGVSGWARYSMSAVLKPSRASNASTVPLRSLNSSS